MNQAHLNNAISVLEKGYVDSKIELIKIPVFNKLIDADIKKEKNKDRIKDLQNAKEQNLLQAKGHKESLGSLEEIISEAKKFKKKRFIFF